MGIQRAYNVINSKTGLIVQQLPHHSQHQQQQQLIHHSYEDKIPSQLNRNTESLHPLLNANVNETTDGSHLNGQSLIGTDLTSSTSSLSSSLSSQNNANSDTKSISGFSSSTTSTTNNNSSNNSNSVSLKNDNNNENNNYSSFKNTSNTNNVPKVSNSSNNLKNNSSANDWHKVKRRPVVANNEMEQELALQITTAPKKTVDTNQNIANLSQSLSQQMDSKVQQSVANNKVDQSLSIEDRLTNQCDLIQTKLDKSIEKDSVDSEINLIKEQQQQQREQNHERCNSNLMIENNKENVCDEEQTEENHSSHFMQTKCIGGSKRAKGNLKSQQLTAKGDCVESSSCPLAVSRRVSFDPLALLLDAALEGELELVKKTANEVSL
jgi:hypothetical protein